MAYLHRDKNFGYPPPPPINNKNMFITIPAACFFLFPIQFAFGAVTVGEVAASGGSTKDHASVKAAQECSPSFQIEKNANKIDYGILQTCPEDKDCVDDHTSSLGGRCVERNMFSDGITSASAPTPCTFANGTQGSKCTGANACGDSNITRIGCGSCHGNNACENMAANTIIGENSCHGDGACQFTNGKSVTRLLVNHVTLEFGIVSSNYLSPHQAPSETAAASGR